MSSLIGATTLTDLSADDVDDWLDGLTAKLATRSLQGVYPILKRSIRQAQARDRVLRNATELVTTPKGKARRPSNAMTFEQATAMLSSSGGGAWSSLTGSPEPVRAENLVHVMRPGDIR